MENNFQKYLDKIQIQEHLAVIKFFFVILAKIWLIFDHPSLKFYNYTDKCTKGLDKT